jgi:hypothetical protein
MTMYNQYCLGGCVRVIRAPLYAGKISGQSSPSQRSCTLLNHTESAYYELFPLLFWPILDYLGDPDAFP